MKFYLTVETQEKIRSTFINLNIFYIIDVQEILDSFNLDISKPSNVYFINQHIEKLIVEQSKSKRLQGIIYINKHLTLHLIEHLYNIISELPKIEGMVLMDDSYFPKLKKFHHYFEEVMFFPAVKKVKILECKPICGTELDSSDYMDDSSILSIVNKFIKPDKESLKKS